MKRSADLLVGAAVSLVVHGGLLGGALFLSSAGVRPALPLFPEGESSLAMTFVAAGSAPPAPTAPAAPRPARIYTEPAEPVALKAPEKPATPPPIQPNTENEELKTDEGEAPVASAGTAPAGQPTPTGAPTADADEMSKGVAGGVRMTAGLRPVYPLGSRLRGEEGVVRLRITVSPKGQAREITVLQSSGYPALDEAAQSAARRARFAPATQNGKPVESQLPLNFRFRLTD